MHAPIHRRGIKCVLHIHMTYTTALSQLEDMRIQPSSQNGVSGHGPWGRDPHVFRRHETSAKSRRVGFRRII
ncbi:class II aldolase/adducin family protein [Mesorhizobium sp. M1136]|uniref:class II aldolase/adducin family protein n=1 Tax=Mesorhizobium sp. M1136 TaxID=2957059 RepID=UPI00333B4B1B